MSSPGHEWAPHEREGWSVCSRCGMVRNYDRETTTCSGSLPKIRQRSEIEDCGQDGVCKLSPGCNRHWEERNRELVRENEVLRSNCDHLSSENASLAALPLPPDVVAKLAEADRLRRLFDDAGVAHALGIKHIQQVSEWERGDVRPGRKHLAKLAEVLGLEIADLLPRIQPDLGANQ